MMYACYSGYDVVELALTAARAGFTVWVPIEKYKKVGAEDGLRAAMPGYIFVLYSERQDFTTLAGARFRLRVVLEYTAAPGMSRAVHEKAIRPHLTSKEELDIMDAMLEEQWARVCQNRAEPGMVYGDKLTVAAGPYRGCIGTIREMRGSSIRLQVGTKIIGLPRAFVQHTT